MAPGVHHSLRSFTTKSSYHSVRVLGASLPLLPVRRRKYLLKLVRIQQKPSNNHRLRKLLGKGYYPEFFESDLFDLADSDSDYEFVSQCTTDASSEFELP